MKNNIIIIADDQSIHRDLLGELIKRNHSNYDLEYCISGEEVERRFVDRGFHGVGLVVVDEVMDPGLRGSELIKKYSNVARQAGCKMILYTAEGDELGIRAVKYGAFDYIIKSISVVKTEEVLKKALNI